MHGGEAAAVGGVQGGDALGQVDVEHAEEVGETSGEQENVMPVEAEIELLDGDEQSAADLVPLSDGEDEVSSAEKCHTKRPKLI